MLTARQSCLDGSGSDGGGGPSSNGPTPPSGITCLEIGMARLIEVERSDVSRLMVFIPFHSCDISAKIVTIWSCRNGS
jgi:hypothetical protein